MRCTAGTICCIRVSTSWIDGDRTGFVRDLLPGRKKRPNICSVSFYLCLCVFFGPASDLFAGADLVDMLEKVKHLVGICPFIIVPGDELYKSI